ncbi:MAG: hypothetical protein FWB85_04585 [Chitinispirillia bacterium]|nr:hypothetical protein [Chitinispirillia bacterium]MCL2241855.1 hypothetical protein [Chitinispirillia bacterium]
MDEEIDGGAERELSDSEMGEVTGGVLPSCASCPCCGYLNHTYGASITCASCGLKYQSKDRRW